MGTKTALCDPNFPGLYRFLPETSTDFLKKMNFFYWLSTIPNLDVSGLFRCFFPLAKWLDWAECAPRTLCGPLRLDLRCVETGSKTG